ncbi:MAG: hypothetical protein PF570_05555 [Candidatus Cloacimonetes bacterium]|jgi:hypothetical protein|nr:hypothetical protein [Candidatus Cloacimonadota bacterium]
MDDDKFNKINELVHHAATWEYVLIHELAELKKIRGYVGAEELLDRELKKYPRLSVPSGHYLMQLVSVLEKLYKLEIPHEIYQKLPLSRWKELLAIVTKENAFELADHLINGGELREIREQYARGLELRYNLYFAGYEFIKMDGKNENVKG